MFSLKFMRPTVWMCAAWIFLGWPEANLWASGGGGSKDKPADKGQGGGHGGGGESAPPTAPKATSGYVHQWIKMPPVHAASVLGVSGEDIRARPGRALVLIFMASWCEPCQELVGELRRLEGRYEGLAVDFYYIFAHDTRDDAGGFLREHGMPKGYVANHDVLQSYHNPELPSVYVGDRDGFLLTRYTKTSRKDVEDLNGLLRKITAF